MFRLLILSLLLLPASISTIAQEDSVLSRKDTLLHNYTVEPPHRGSHVKVITDNGTFKGVLLDITDQSLVIGNKNNMTWATQELMSREINQLIIRERNTFATTLAGGAILGLVVGLKGSISSNGTGVCLKEDGTINYGCTLSVTSAGTIVGGLIGAIVSPFLHKRFTINKNQLNFDLHRPRISQYAAYNSK